MRFGSRLFLLTILTAPSVASAGGAPYNVAVVGSSARADGVALLEHYAATRAIPDENLCVLDDVPDPQGEPPSPVIDLDTYERTVLGPVSECLDASPWADDIDFLVTVRGMPYHVQGEGVSASLEAMLTVGRSTLRGRPLWREPPPTAGRFAFLSPHYRASALYGLTAELAAGGFPSAPRWLDAPPGQVLVVEEDRAAPQGPVVWDLRPTFRLDAGSLEDARSLVDRSVAADGTAPDGMWLCMAGADAARGVRDVECAAALGLLGALGHRVDHHPWDAGLVYEEPVIAYLTGAADLRGAIDGVAWQPGAIADNITSFGAVPANWTYEEAGGESQTSIVRFLAAGATATHGTSAEPYNAVFASAGLMVLYATGYTLGESYTLSLPFLRWMNVPVGDPLCAPYARRPDVAVEVPEPLYADGEVRAVATAAPGWAVQSIGLWVRGRQVLRTRGAELTVPGAELGVGAGVAEAMVVAVARPEPIDVAPPFTARSVAPRPDVSGWRSVAFEYVDAPAPAVEPDPEPDAAPVEPDVPSPEPDAGEGGEPDGAADVGPPDADGPTAPPAAVPHADEGCAAAGPSLPWRWSARR